MDRNVGVRCRNSRNEASIPCKLAPEWRVRIQFYLDQNGLSLQTAPKSVLNLAKTTEIKDGGPEQTLRFCGVK